MTTDHTEDRETYLLARLDTLQQMLEAEVKRRIELEEEVERLKTRLSE